MSRSSSVPARTPSGIANRYLVEPFVITVCVEGPDDVPFWSIVFPKVYAGYKVKVKHANGVGRAMHVFYRIKEGKTKRTIVAVDSEYDEIVNDKPRHRLLVKTQRHSIENYLYDPVVVDRIVCLYCRKQESTLCIGNDWANNMANAFRGLLVLDIVANYLKAGVQVMGDSGDRFYHKNGSNPAHDLIDSETNRALMLLRARSSEDEIADAIHKVLLKLVGSNMMHFIRGHTLTAAVRRLVRVQVHRHTAKDINMPNDQMIPTFISALLSIQGVIPDFRKMKKRARNALVNAVRVTDRLPQS